MALVSRLPFPSMDNLAFIDKYPATLFNTPLVLLRLLMVFLTVHILKAELIIKQEAPILLFLQAAQITS